MNKQLVAVDVIDLDDAVEDAEQVRAAAERAAARFDTAAADIAAIAAFIRDNPHLATHMQYAGLEHGTRVNVYVGYSGGAATVAEFARAAVRAGRKVVKTPGGTADQFFGVEIHFGWAHIYVYTSRDEVCERVVVGTREVVEVIPDPEALAKVPTVEVTKTVEDVEWRCGSLLGGGSGA